MPIQYAGIIEEHRAVRSAAGPVRPLAHGRARGRGRRCRRGPRRCARHRPAGPRRGPGALLDDLRARRRDPRRPDRLPPGRGPVHGRRQRVERAGRVGRAGRAARGFSRRPRRPVARDRRSSRSRARAPRHPRTARRRSTSAAIRYYGIAEGDRRRASRRRSRAPATPARTASSCSSTSIGWGTLWDALLEAGRPHGQVPVGPRGPRHAPARGRHAAVRQRARPRRPTRSRPGLARVVKLSKAGDFVGRAALERVVRDGVAAPARRPRGARPRHRPSRLSGAGPTTAETRSSPAARRRHRHPARRSAPSPRARCRIGDGLRAARRCRTRYDAGRGGSWNAGRRRGRPAPVLQAPRLSRQRVQPSRPPADAKDGGARWSPTTGALPRSTSGSASRATRPSSGSRSTPRTSWATSCSSSCRRWAGRSSSSRRSAWSSR